MRILKCLAIFLATFCILLGQSEGAENGLVGYWKFDKIEDNTAKDSSEMGNQGELVGDIEQVDDQFGDTALKFNGGACVKIEYSDSLNLKDGFTIAFWAKPDESQDNWAKIICKPKEGDDYPLSIQYDDGNNIKIELTSKNGNKWSQDTDNFTEWGHLALVYDGGTIRLYKDGQEVLSGSIGGELLHTEKPITIGGKNPAAPTQCYHGLIDEVKIYNKALSPEEVEQSMEPEAADVSQSGKLAVRWAVIKQNTNQ